MSYLTVDGGRTLSRQGEPSGSAEPLGGGDTLRGPAGGLGDVAETGFLAYYHHRASSLMKVIGGGKSYAGDAHPAQRRDPKPVALRELKILAVADEVDPRLYGSRAARYVGSTPDLILGCGDLPSYYLDYLVSRFDVPLFAIHGNHDAPPPIEGSAGFAGCGATWISGSTVRAGQLLLAGFDGSLRYNGGAYQSSQAQMQVAVRSLVPWLWLNRVRYGRFLDVLITHAPPRGIHDGPDRCHTGFDAFRWLVTRFQPRYHLHGHVHVYDNRTATVTRLGVTDVINVYPFRELTLTVPPGA